MSGVSFAGYPMGSHQASVFSGFQSNRRTLPFEKRREDRPDRRSQDALAPSNRRATLSEVHTEAAWEQRLR